MRRLFIFCAACLLFGVAQSGFAQTWIDSEIHGGALCDPKPTTRWILTEKLDGTPVEQELVWLKDGVDLSGRDLAGVEILNVKLQNVDFSGSVFKNADFSQAVFVNCNFSNAVLQNVRTDGDTIFTSCKFDGAQARQFDYSKLAQEEVDSLNILDSDNLDDVTLSGPYYGLTSEQLKKTRSYKDKLFKNVSFFVKQSEDKNKPNRLDYSNIDFSDCTFVNCTFQGVNLKDANFKNATFIKTSLFLSYNLTAKQLKETWNWQNKRMEWVLPSWYRQEDIDKFTKSIGIEFDAKTGGITETKAN